MLPLCCNSAALRVHSARATFLQTGTRRAGWPGKNAWHRSHLAYWPRHNHKDIIWSAGSPLLFLPDFFFCLSFMCLCPVKHERQKAPPMKRWEKETCFSERGKNLMKWYFLPQQFACVGKFFSPPFMVATKGNTVLWKSLCPLPYLFIYFCKNCNQESVITANESLTHSSLQNRFSSSTLEGCRA